MQAGIALGSNIEPRLLNLQTASQRVRSLHSGREEPLCSPIYETSPVDCPQGSPNFLNAVMEITTNLEPEGLLKYLQAIESDLGRPGRRVKNSPRIVDLDLLYCDDMTRSLPDFILPHPRIVERLFVLKPLSDIRPGLKLQIFPATAKEMVDKYSGMEKISIIENVMLL